MSHARIQAASLGQSTRQILADGFYQTATGHIVDLVPLRAALESARDVTDLADTPPGRPALNDLLMRLRLARG